MLCPFPKWWSIFSLPISEPPLKLFGEPPWGRPPPSESVQPNTVAALYRSEPVCSSSCLFHVTVWHLSVMDCFVHMETSQLPAQCNLSVVQHFSSLSLPSHITACVGLKARCTIFIYSPNLHITFPCYNDKPVVSPPGVIKFHLVFFFFIGVTAEIPHFPLPLVDMTAVYWKT